MQQLQELENELILFINYDGSYNVDRFWWMFSSKFTWIATVLTIVAYFAWKAKKWREVLLILTAFVIMGLLTDWVSSNVFKPIFARLRPSHNPDIIDSLYLYVDSAGHLYHGGAYGFFSAHAANSFGAITMLGLIFRRKWVIIAGAIWALAFCYSRLYLGVHYVGDVLVGMIWGCLVGALVYHGYARVHRRLEKKWNLLPIREIYDQEPWPVIIVHYTAIAVIAIIAFF